jgi:hypothetical protein
MAELAHELAAMHFTRDDGQPLVAREVEGMVVACLGLMLREGFEPFTPEQFERLIFEWVEMAAKAAKEPT